MSDLLIPTTSKTGLWQWLLRSTGLEAWFQQGPTATHLGRQERLLLALPGTTRATRAAHTMLLVNALRECQPSLVASGGAAVAYQPGTLLLTWPAAAESSAPVVALYAQLLACVRRLAGSPTLALNGAAGLGWAAPGAATAPRQYEQAVLRAVNGLLHESQQLGGELLLTAALQQRLTPAVAGQCALHVAFEVPGHRYPATVYRVLAPPAVAESVAEREELKPQLSKKYSH